MKRFSRHAFELSPNKRALLDRKKCGQHSLLSTR